MPLIRNMIDRSQLLDFTWWFAALSKILTLRYGLLIALSLSFGSIFSLSLDVSRALDGLKQAPRDNINWSILQLQTEFLRMRAELNRLKLAEAATTDSFVQAFDIFYSRVQTLKTAPILEPIRNKSAFLARIKKAQGLLDDIAPIVDAGPVDIRKSLTALSERINREQRTVQDLVVSSVAEFAEIEDRERARLTMLIAALACAGLVVFVSLLAAVLVLRRHSDRLQRRSQELAESQTRLAATVGSALDAIIVTDEFGTIIDFNAQASTCFGYAREDAIGKCMADLIVPESMRAAHLAGMRRYRQTRQPKIVGKRIEIDALHAEGHEFPIELALGVASHGATIHFVAFARDISQRRRDHAALMEAKDEANAANHAKSRFLAVMSHEMRTPLNGILGVLQLLRDTRLDTEQQRLVDIANISGEALLDLINDVLDLSKMQAGKFELDPQTFKLRELPQSVCEIVASDAAIRGNAIEIDFPVELDHCFCGDAKRLRQVLLNLVSNANKFTSQGTIRVCTQMLNRRGNRAKLRITVEDTGIGIPPDRISSLFTEFTTLDSSYARNQSGTGLGLAISKRIMDLFEGTICVESELGKGSKFWIEVELDMISDCAEQCDSKVEETQIGVCNRTLNVLLAEDNATNAMVAKAMLRGAGHSVEVVGDGQEAISKVMNLENGKSYDVVLMDISMPGMDGMEATRHIRAMTSPAGDVPIIALTAHTQPKLQEEIIAAGMQSVLTKPIQKTQLLAAVQDLARSSVVEADIEQTTNAARAREISSVVLDRSQLDQLLLDVGPETGSELISQFSTDVKDAAYDIVSSEDVGDLKSAAHRLAGCAATVGATALSQAAHELEAACGSGDRRAIDGLIGQVQNLQVRTLREIEIVKAQPPIPPFSKPALGT